MSSQSSLKKLEGFSLLSLDLRTATKKPTQLQLHMHHYTRRSLKPQFTMIGSPKYVVHMPLTFTDVYEASLSVGIFSRLVVS